VIDRRAFLLSTAALLAGVPTCAHARPRLYSTGFLLPEIELTYESIEVLRQILLRVQRVGLMHNPDWPVDPLRVRQSLRLAEKIGVRFMPAGVRWGDDVEPAFGTLLAEGADAVIVPAGVLLAGFHRRIVEQAAANRLPALYGARGLAEAGGLISVSPNCPAELSVDQPSNFELIVNLKTAGALGLTVPKSVLLRADRLIE